MQRPRNPQRDPRATRLTPGRARAPRSARFTIWILLLGVLISGSLAASTLQARRVSAAERAGIALVAPQPSILNQTGSLLTSGTPAGYGADAPALDSTLCQAPGVCITQPGVSRPQDVLPAWRWQEIGNFPSDTGFGLRNLGAISDNILNLISKILFTIANLAWRILLWAVKLGVDNDWLRDSAYTVNQMVLQLAFPAMLIGALLWLVTLAKGAKLGLKGDMAGVLRLVALFLVPLGLLIMVYGGAKEAVRLGDAKLEVKCQGSTGENPDCAKQLRDAGNAAVDTPLSVTWLAGQVQSRLGSVTEEFAKALTFGGGDGAQKTLLGDMGGKAIPNCGAYVAAMWSQYNALGGPGTRAAFLHANVAWLNGMYKPWSLAGFGDSVLRNDASCHYLDDVNGVPAAQQQATMGIAYPELVTSLTNGGYRAAGHDSAYTTVAFPMTCEEAAAMLRGGEAGKEGVPTVVAAKSDDPDTCNPEFMTTVAEKVGKDYDASGGSALFGTGKSASDAAKFATSGKHNSNGNDGSAQQQLRVFNWAACTYKDGHWEARESWAGIKNTTIASQDGKNSAGKVVGMVSAYCTVRWNFGTGDGNLGGLDGTGLASATTGIDDQLGDIGGGEVNSKIQNPKTRAAVSAYLGKAGSERLTYAVMVLVGSYAYFRLVGIPALGLLVATFALILLLSFLPLILVGVAGGSQGAKKLLRMTVATAGSKALFSILVLAVIEIHIILTGLVTSMQLTSTASMAGAATADTLNTMILMVLPLGIVFLMDKLTSTLGLGKLSSLKGGASFAMTAASKAAGAGSMSGFLAGGGGKGGALSRGFKSVKNKTTNTVKEEYQTRREVKRTGQAADNIRATNRDGVEKADKKIEELEAEKKSLGEGGQLDPAQQKELEDAKANKARFEIEQREAERAHARAIQQRASLENQRKYTLQKVAMGAKVAAVGLTLPASGVLALGAVGASIGARATYKNSETLQDYGDVTKQFAGRQVGRALHGTVNSRPVRSIVVAALGVGMIAESSAPVAELKKLKNESSEKRKAAGEKGSAYRDGGGFKGAVGSAWGDE